MRKFIQDMVLPTLLLLLTGAFGMLMYTLHLEQQRTALPQEWSITITYSSPPTQ